MYPYDISGIPYQNHIPSWKLYLALASKKGKSNGVVMPNQIPT